MRRYEPNQFFEDRKGHGKKRCLYRCKLIKFDVVEKGNKLNGFTRRKQIRDTTENVCRLKRGQSKICSYKNDSEKTCNIARE